MKTMPDFPFTGWSEWDSVAYLLDAPILRFRAAPFLNAARRSIDWEGLTAACEPWSHAERLIIALASDLWRSSGGISVRELCATLDDDNFARALAAIEIARGRPRLLGAFADPELDGGEAS